jgi:hypothetical protein
LHWDVQEGQAGVNFEAFQGYPVAGFKLLFWFSLLIPYLVSLYPWAWKYIPPNSTLVEIPRKNNHLCAPERPLVCTYFCIFMGA